MKYLNSSLFTSMPYQHSSAWENRVEAPDMQIANYKHICNIRHFHLIAEPIKHNILSNLTIEALGYNGTTPGPLIIVKQGEWIYLTVENTEEGSVEVYISEYLRDTYIYIVAAIFVALILVIGRLKGLKTIITLMLTILLILKGLLPGLLAGYSPIILTIGIAFIITLITILTIGGFTRKSYAAIIGVLGGVFAAGLIAYVIGSQVKLTGLSSEEAVMLLYIPQGIQFDFRGLLFSGIIIGASGAVMDVGMSISSSMEEIKNANPSISKKALMMSGMNVGKDIMGTMANL